MSRSPSDINAKNMRLLTCDLGGPMVRFSFCQAEGRRSSHVVDVVDFLFFTSFFKLDRFFFSLCER